MLRKIILLQLKKIKTKYLLHLAYSSNISPMDCHFQISCILIGKYFSSKDKFEETFYEYTSGHLNEDIFIKRSGGIYLQSMRANTLIN